jgi:hypothetical protein
VAAIPDRRRRHHCGYRGQIYPLGAEDCVTRNPPDLRMRGGGVLSALDLTGGRMSNIETMTDEEFKAARAKLDALRAELAARTQPADIDVRPTINQLPNEVLAALVVIASMTIIGGALWTWFDGWPWALWARFLGWL